MKNLQSIIPVGDLPYGKEVGRVDILGNRYQLYGEGQNWTLVVSVV